MWKREDLREMIIDCNEQLRHRTGNLHRKEVLQIVRNRKLYREILEELELCEEYQEVM